LKTKRDTVLGADIRQTISDASTTAETVSNSTDDGANAAEEAFGDSTQEDTDALSYFEKLAKE